MACKSVPAWRFGAVYAALFAALGVSLPFLPVWLAERGLDSASIGIVVGAPILLRVLLTPLVAEAADRSGRPVLMLRLVVIATLASYVLLDRSEGFWWLLLANGLAQATSAAALPLFDSLAVRRRGVGAFGPVRLWGSVAFIAASLAGGALIAVLPADNVVWMIAGCQFVACLATVLLLSDERVDPGGGHRQAPPTHLLLTPGLAVVVLAAALIQSSHGAFYGFSSLHWRELGLDGATIGTLWAVGVTAEVCVFAASSRWPASVGPGLLMGLGAGAAVVRWSLMSFDPLGPFLVLLQCLHALSFAATYLGAVGALAAVAPVGAEARAQAVGSTVQSVAIAGAIALSGQLHTAIGADVFLAMAAIAALGGLVLVVGRAVLPPAQPHRLGSGGWTSDPS